MKQITTTKATILTVDLAEGSCAINIGYNAFGVFLWYKHGHRRYERKLDIDKPFRTKKVGWKILGMANDLTEEQWKRIVEEITIKSNIIKSFRNYERKMPQWIYACSTATESGHSLLKANGIVLSNPYPSPKDKQPLCRDCADEDGTCPNYNGRYCNPDLRQSQYVEAQSKVTNPLILIKLR